MKRPHCSERYSRHDACTCSSCYKNRDVRYLEDKIDFLMFRTHQSNFHDVILVATAAQGSTAVPIPAHKAVLADRSPVFKAMLETDMEESRSGTIRISDVSSGVLRMFVEYLYTAEALLDEQSSFELLALAEKYEVKHLKAYCEKWIISKLSRDKAISTYVFAHQHKAERLVAAALSLIVDFDNLKKLSTTDDYIELVKNDPKLVVEIYEHKARLQDQ